MQEARDPSYFVAQQLQNHVHLISGYRYPHLPTLTLEQALRYLIDAPTIVKANAPMAWQYVQTPPDGTLWLEWVSMRNNAQHRFPSDGFAWADPEQANQREFGGYTIEWMTHTLGFKPGQEHTAQHARTRFHFVAKNPSVNAPPPDPSLWIVHYHQADPSRMMPTAQIPIGQGVRQQLSERRWLEMQGRLERKDFMLHDREHWPTITVPQNAATLLQQQQQQAMQQQPMYANPAMMQQQMGAAGMHRFPQQQFSHGQAPPAKRARHSGPHPMPGSADGVHDTSIEEEENQLLDYFDNLTPRDISLARYTQHHRWMEEVFNSPYASSNIVPPDLGLGLMGELKGLTDGILNPPSVEEIKDLGKEDDSRPREAKEAQPFTNLKQEQLDEFNRRVEKHLEEGHAEIERMKKEHAEKMAEWKKSKNILQAERRLRHATWEGHENGTPAVFRLEIPQGMNGHAEEGGSTETVEDVVRDVEQLLGVKIKAHDDATMIKRGGLEEEEEAPRNVDAVMDAEPDSTAPAASAQPTGTTLVQGGEGPVQQPMHSQPPQGQASQPPVNVPRQPTEPTALEQPQEGDDMLQESFVADDLDDQHGFDNGDDLVMDDMDMDMDTGDIDFVQHDEDEFGNTPMTMTAPDASNAPEQEPELPLPVDKPNAEPAPLPEVDTAVQGDVPAPELPQQEEPLELEPRAEESAIPALAADASLGNEPDVPAISALEPPEEPTSGGIGEFAAGDTMNSQNDTDIFGDGTFDDLPGMGGEDDNDDGLLDFDGGMDMQDTAFGDAIHGMSETNSPNVVSEGLGATPVVEQDVTDQSGEPGPS